MRNSRKLSRLRTFPSRAPNTKHSSIWCVQARVSGMQSTWCDDCSQSNVRPPTCTGVLSFREWRHVYSKNVVMALNNLETLFCLLFNWHQNHLRSHRQGKINWSSVERYVPDTVEILSQAICQMREILFSVFYKWRNESWDFKLWKSQSEIFQFLLFR